ncbi:MAG: hypothetical protein ACK4K7_13025 [Allosphingosinicella sp.]|uniref:hypothetical protein n=1 Tax=Allosphingosinicella sp. TaxID=2823234 RepID=UPI00393DC355
MQSYYVNRNQQSNGDHEVHVRSCRYFPSSAQYLGEFGSCHGAVLEAKRDYPRANGCAYCCPACHTS